MPRLAILVIVLLASGCAGTLRFDLQVCHLVSPASDELTCQDHGTIESPFTADHLSEQDALDVRVCSQADGYDALVLDADGNEVTLERGGRFAGGDRCPFGTTLEWGRTIELGARYEVVLDPVSCPRCADEPTRVTISAADAVLATYDVVLDRRRTIAVLAVSAPRE